MPPFKNFVDVLQTRAREDPQRQAFTFLRDGERDEITLTYEELDRRARAIAALLQGPHPAGTRVILLYPPGLDYIAALFGCFYGGFIAVPAYPPDPSRLSRTLPRLRAMVADAGAGVVLTTSPILAMTAGLAELAPELGHLRWIATDGFAEGLEREWRPYDPDREDIALLLFGLARAYARWTSAEALRLVVGGGPPRRHCGWSW